MVDPHHEPSAPIATDKARAGSTPGVTRYVLAASLVLVIVAFVIIYIVH